MGIDFAIGVPELPQVHHRLAFEPARCKFSEIVPLHQNPAARAAARPYALHAQNVAPGKKVPARLVQIRYFNRLHVCPLVRNSI